MKIESRVKISAIESKRIDLRGPGAAFRARVSASGPEHQVVLGFDASSEFARTLAAEGIHKTLRVTIEIEDEEPPWQGVALNPEDIKELKGILDSGNLITPSNVAAIASAVDRKNLPDQVQSPFIQLHSNLLHIAPHHNLVAATLNACLDLAEGETLRKLTEFIGRLRVRGDAR